MKKQNNTDLKSVKNTKSKDVKYTFDDLRDVWYCAIFNGAVLWQYATEKNLTKKLNVGVDAIRDLLDEDTLRLILGNNMVLLGLFQEKTESKKVKKK